MHWHIPRIAHDIGGQTSKQLCLSCKVSFKACGTCGCKDIKLVTLGVRLRAPKASASKYRWKQFWKAFVIHTGIYNMAKETYPEEVRTLTNT